MELSFDGFLQTVEPQYRGFVEGLHTYLLGSGCKLKLQLAKGGQYVVSYQYDKRVVLNYVFRKIGLLVRIYADRSGGYLDFIDTLPDSIVKSIDKSASECRQCNARCPKGYIFDIRGKHYFKCRYNAFMFAVNDDSMPVIREFMENEITQRVTA